MLNPEKISHQQLGHLPTSPVYCNHFTLGNPKKSFFQQYYTYILQIIYIISEENKLLPPLQTIDVKFSQDLIHRKLLKSVNF